VALILSMTSMGGVIEAQADTLLGNIKEA